MAFGIDDAIAAGLKIIDKFIPDPTEKAKATLELQQLGNQIKLAQIDLDKAEVQSGSLLGKWRGFLGWACAGSLVYQLVLYPTLIAILVSINPEFPVDSLPKLELQQLGQILMGMLGLGS